MGVAVALDPADLRVEPGSEAAAEIKIRNTGDVVDQIDLDVLGDAAQWASVEPPKVNLLPGQEATARLRFAPPRSPKVPAGETPYALRAMSREDTGGSVIEESAVTVEPFMSVVAELVPRTARGSRQGRAQLAVDNLGNKEQRIAVRPTDPDRMLDFRVHPPVIETTPDTATFVRLKALPRKRFLRGPDKTLPFQITVLPEGGEPVTVDAAMLQRPLVAPWLAKLILLAVAAVIGLVVAWHTVLKPQVESTAKEVALVETAALSEEIKQVEKKADDAAADADAARDAAGVPPLGTPAAADPAEGGATRAPEKRGQVGDSAEASRPGRSGSSTDKDRGVAASARSAGGSPTAMTLDPESAIDFRVETSVKPEDPPFTENTYIPPAGKVAWITDIVLQNPRGDSGILRIQRGPTVLFEFGLNNFRDLDYHLIQPLRFTATEPVVVAVDCTNATAACTPSVYFTGRTTAAPAADGADGSQAPAATGAGAGAEGRPADATVPATTAGTAGGSGSSG